MGTDHGLSTFLSVRARLVTSAYRMLGSTAAAEDVVQDTWIRWQSTNRDTVRDAGAFLTTTAIRLAINVRQSARARMETRLAPWHPDPIDPRSEITQAERAHALTLGAFVLLERLSSAERAAYILREAFDYAYRDIAGVLDMQEANARQLVGRARLHLTRGPRAPVLAEDHRQLVAALGAAARAGDTRGLIELFTAETRRHAHRRMTPSTASNASRTSQDGETDA
jgi:RNA polymerase sigma-70 factor, ECF subfamily